MNISLTTLRRNGNSEGRIVIRELIRASQDLRQQNKWREAARHLLEAFRRSVTLLGENHPVTSSLRLRVNRALELLGHPHETTRQRSQDGPSSIQRPLEIKL